MMKLIIEVFTIAVLMVSVDCFAQKNHQMTNQEIVQKFLEGFNDPALIKESLALLADDYQFTNPMVKLNSKVEFIELAEQIGSVLTGLDIRAIAENGDWVAVYYNFKSSISGLESNNATEWFRLENGVIKESDLIYDTSKWRIFYAQLKE